MWPELELDVDGTQLRASGRGSRGERPPPHIAAINEDPAHLAPLLDEIEQAGAA